MSLERRFDKYLTDYPLTSGKLDELKVVRAELGEDYSDLQGQFKVIEWITEGTFGGPKAIIEIGGQRFFFKQHPDPFFGLIPEVLSAKRLKQELPQNTPDFYRFCELIPNLVFGVLLPDLSMTPQGKPQLVISPNDQKLSTEEVRKAISQLPQTTREEIQKQLIHIALASAGLGEDEVIKAAGHITAEDRFPGQRQWPLSLTRHAYMLVFDPADIQNVRVLVVDLCGNYTPHNDFSTITGIARGNLTEASAVSQIILGQALNPSLYPKYKLEIVKSNQVARELLF